MAVIPVPFPFRLWCREVLGSKDYREQMRKRLMNGTLPKNLEMMMHHYAWGKPTDVVEVVDNRKPTTAAEEDTAQLASRAQSLAREILQLQESEKTGGALKPGNGHAN